MGLPGKRSPLNRGSYSAMRVVRSVRLMCTGQRLGGLELFCLLKFVAGLAGFFGCHPTSPSP